jgi:hypothetical protein
MVSRLRLLKFIAPSEMKFKRIGALILIPQFEICDILKD